MRYFCVTSVACDVIGTDTLFMLIFVVILCPVIVLVKNPHKPENYTQVISAKLTRRATALAVPVCRLSRSISPDSPTVSAQFTYENCKKNKTL